MPTSGNPTVQLIEREISDLIEREKELRTFHSRIPQGEETIETNGNHSNDSISPTPPQEEETAEEPPVPEAAAKPPLLNSKSTGAIPNGNRRFVPNPTTRGVMHKFIKSRGKLTTIANFKPAPEKPAQTWTVPDVVEPPRVIDPSQCVRRGFVPVEEKMKKELMDLHTREMELRTERKKSQPDFNSIVDDEPPSPIFEKSNLTRARSMAQLYVPDDYPPPTLKAARSLAELCDAPDDDLDVPGSHFLIMRWEEMIQKNQQARS